MAEKQNPDEQMKQFYLTLKISSEVFDAAERIMCESSDVHYPRLRFKGTTDSFAKFQHDVSLVAETILEIKAGCKPLQ